MDVKTRLKSYLAAKNVSQLAFCNAIGVSSAYIANMRNSISPEKIERIAKMYPDLNLAWLLTGNGNMLTDSKLSIQNVTAENSAVNTGSGSAVNNVGSDDNFWKGLVNELRDRIAELKGKCDEKDLQIKEFSRLLEDAKAENERLKKG